MFLDKSINSRAFAKGTPTLFVLDTPFQLLCAMEFMAEFAVEDYLIIAALTPNEMRNNQVLEMLREQRLKYQIEWVYDYWGMINKCLSQELVVDSQEGNCKWSRVVIGNYNALDQWVTATKYADKNAVLIYTDDGSSSIVLLKRGKGHNKEYESKFNYLWKKLGIENGLYIYTIYGDIKTKKFNVHPNMLSHIATPISQNKEMQNVYIIGTNSKPYSNVMGVSLAEYEGILWQKLSEIKKTYPTEKIIYIPHGRDTDDVISNFCRILGVEYLRLTCAVEYYFIQNQICAKAIYGFGSTALLTLKMLMPKVKVVNWLLNNPQSEGFRSYYEIAKYYHQHSVIVVPINYPHQGLMKQWIRGIKHFLHLCKVKCANI